jgi:DNA (cytosine-5)-methyltransferase 1
MRLLDLFCGAGGAAEGYHQAGFEVVGVDIKPQLRFPFEFHQGDAFNYLRSHGHEFDVIHASPPCQRYTKARKLRGREHPDLIAPLRLLLQDSGKPWVIENVPGAPLINPVMLCGAMFGLHVYRHRLFEASFEFEAPDHLEHTARQAKMGRPVLEGDFIQPVGHFSNVPYAKWAMRIPWMTQHELAEAIPPAYTKWVGLRLMDIVRA